MALTKPRFSGRLKLDPVTKRDVNSFKVNPCDSVGPVVVLRPTKGTLPPLYGPKLTETERHVLQEKVHIPHQAYKVAHTCNKDSIECEVDFLKEVKRKSWFLTRGSKENTLSDSNLKPILLTNEESPPSLNKFLYRTRHSKRVSFTIPSIRPGDRQSHNNTDDKVDNLLDVDDDVPSLISPVRTYHLTKKETTSETILKLPTLSNLSVSQQTEMFPGDPLPFSKRIYYKDLQTQFEYDFSPSLNSRSSVQKSKSNRTKQSLNSRKVPKFVSTLNSRTPTMQQTSPYVDSIYARARQLLQDKIKEKHINIPRHTRRKRVLFLPSLAAPCSEEFAITMRRTHGKRFVSSPAVLDHVVHGRLPFHTTSALLDAIIRPPSTPTNR